MQPLHWIKTTDAMPDPKEHDRVLVYTRNRDFYGQRVFDVATQDFLYYRNLASPPESIEEKIHSSVTHWMPHPSQIFGEPKLDVGKPLRLKESLEEVEFVAEDEWDVAVRLKTGKLKIFLRNQLENFGD